MASYLFGNLAGSLPLIVEQRPPQPAVDDENGLTAARRFSIIASSDVAAILLLRQAGIRRGTVFEDPFGNVPDPYCLCQRVQAMGRPPATRLGVGQYITDCFYARTQRPPGPVPGGRTVWRSKPSVTTVPADIDYQGVAIETSSEEAVDPPLTRREIERSLIAEFYWKAPDELAALLAFRKWEGKNNSKKWRLFNADSGSVWCNPFEAEPTDTGWVRMSVTFDYRPTKPFKALGGATIAGWTDAFKDRGYRTIGANATNASLVGKYAAIIDPSTQSPVSDPLPLDGYGGINPTGADDVILTADHYDEEDFNQIPFP